MTSVVPLSYRGVDCILMWGKPGVCRSRTGQHRCKDHTRHEGLCTCRYCGTQGRQA